MEERELAVRQVLRGLTYPAEKWQIVTHADLYGADAETRAALHGLAPARVPQPGGHHRGPARRYSHASGSRKKPVYVDQDGVDRAMNSSEFTGEVEPRDSLR
jgi:hypothetical protein